MAGTSYWRERGDLVNRTYPKTSCQVNLLDITQTMVMVILLREEEVGDLVELWITAELEYWLATHVNIPDQPGVLIPPGESTQHMTILSGDSALTSQYYRMHPTCTQRSSRCQNLQWRSPRDCAE